MKNITIQKQEKEVVDTYEIFIPQTVTDQETGAVITYKIKQVVSRSEIQAEYDEKRKELEVIQAKLDLIDSM